MKQKEIKKQVQDDLGDATPKELEKQWRDACVRETEARYRRNNLKKARDSVLDELKQHAAHEPLDKDAVLHLARELTTAQSLYDEAIEAAKKAAASLEAVAEVRGQR